MHAAVGNIINQSERSGVGSKPIPIHHSTNTLYILPAHLKTTSTLHTTARTMYLMMANMNLPKHCKNSFGMKTNLYDRISMKTFINV